MGKDELKDGQGTVLRDGGGNERKSLGQGEGRGAGTGGRVMGHFRKLAFEGKAKVPSEGLGGMSRGADASGVWGRQRERGWWGSPG